MKITIRQNRYDNWYGYRGGKRVIAFGAGPHTTAEAAAREWLARELAAPEKNPAAVALGRLGGLAKSARKAAAVRENGKLGGRPRKSPAVVEHHPNPAALAIGRLPRRR